MWVKFINTTRLLNNRVTVARYDHHKREILIYRGNESNVLQNLLRFA